LRSGSPSDAFNLGNGQGFSVREVLDTAERVTGRKIARSAQPRRAGDPHTLIGSAAKAQRVLGWKPRFASLETILETAWNWERRRHAAA
jgi:UDP-glucose 4-epimerase